MSNVTSKKLKKQLGNPAKTVAPKNATVAKTEKPKTEAPKIKMGKYGAPAVRYNRADKNKPSEFGNRLWVLRCVKTYDAKTLVAQTYVDADPKKHGITPMDKTLAEKIIAATRASADVVNANCRYAGKTADGVTLYLPWIALAADNGKPAKTA